MLAEKRPSLEQDHGAKESHSLVKGTQQDKSYNLKMRTLNFFDGTLKHMGLNPVVHLALVAAMPLSNP